MQPLGGSDKFGDKRSSEYKSLLLRAYVPDIRIRVVNDRGPEEAWFRRRYLWGFEACERQFLRGRNYERAALWRVARSRGAYAAGIGIRFGVAAAIVRRWRGIIERAPSRLANGQPQEWQERMALRRVDSPASSSASKATILGWKHPSRRRPLCSICCRITRPASSLFCARRMTAGRPRTGWRSTTNGRPRVRVLRRGMAEPQSGAPAARPLPRLRRSGIWARPVASVRNRTHPPRLAAFALLGCLARGPEG